MSIERESDFIHELANHLAAAEGMVKRHMKQPEVQTLETLEKAQAALKKAVELVRARRDFISNQSDP